MDIRHYLEVLRHQWRLVLLASLLGLGTATIVTLLAAPIYEARAQLFVSTSQSGSDTVNGLNQGGQFAQQRVKSYAEIVNSPLVPTPVITELNLPYTPAQLAAAVEASAPVDTVLIDVHVRDVDARRAQAIADAVARTFATVATQLEAPIGSTASAVKVSVVRTAEQPAAPVFPRPALNVALGLLVGLGLGVAAALLRDRLDTTLKTGAQLRDALGISPLGQITFQPEAAKEPLIVHAHPLSRRAEAFRQLRTNLQFVDVDQPPTSIVVTSSLAQEGKSTTTCNLAIALSQAGLRVALVDGDLRRPRLATYLGLEGAVGLTDVLIGRATLHDVLQPWGESELLVLASGPTPPNPSELLGSQQMQDLLRELESHVDIVLVDAPPLLPVTDAAVLATLVSGVVLLVRAGKTTREQANRALEILSNVGARVYGAVLNMVPDAGDSQQYGYYAYSQPKDKPAGVASRRS